MKKVVAVVGAIVILAGLFVVFNKPQTSLLASYSNDSKSIREIVERLENDVSGTQQIEAAALPEGIVLNDNDSKTVLRDNHNAFYVAIAPYFKETHECYNHNLNTCQGEQVNKKMKVVVVDENKKEIVNTTKTTAKNGFLGLWLPRNLKGSITITYQGKKASQTLSTTMNSQTCLTQMKLV